MVFYVDGIKYAMAGRKGGTILYRNLQNKALYTLGEYGMVRFVELS